MIKRVRLLTVTVGAMLVVGANAKPAQAPTLEELSTQEIATLLGWVSDPWSDSLCKGHYEDPGINRNTGANQGRSKKSRAKRCIQSSNEKNRVTDFLGVQLTADKTEVFDDEDMAVLDGNVRVSHGKYALESEHAEVFRNDISRQLERLRLSQYVHFWVPGVNIYADDASLNLMTQDAELTGVIYRFIHKKKEGALYARGYAQKIKKLGKNKLKMRGATYTHCPPTSNAWLLKGSKLDLDKASGWGSITHGRLLVGGVPVFYFPYYRFPIDDRRHTGFLLPSMEFNSRSRFDLRLPIYLNLAANYDATLTPRYLLERGWEANVLGRFLTQHQEGQMDVGYLPKDRHFIQFKDKMLLAYPDNTTNRPYLHDLTKAQNSRSRFHLQDKLHWGRYWTMDADLQWVSDAYYFRDLSSSSATTTQDQLLNRINLEYKQGGWHGIARLQGYQTLHQIDQLPVNDQYRQLPFISVTKDVPYLEGATLGIVTEWVNFDRKDDYTTKAPVVKGQRTYMSADIGLPYQSAFAYIKPHWLVQGRIYKLEDASDSIDSDPKRLNHTFFVDSGLRFDRSIDVARHEFVQTLEPRAYYIYSPIEEQDDIPNFDTAWLSSSYDQLFSAHRFGGRDRISDENRIAFGLQTRLLDDEAGSERLRLAVGSGFALAERRVCLTPDCSADDTAKDSISPLAGVFSYSIDDDRQVNASMVWLPQRRQVDHAGVNVHFTSSNDERFDVSYDHYRPSGINGAGKHLISSGLMWPITPALQGILAWDYNVDVKNTEQYLAGLKYESCCWAVRVLTSGMLAQQIEGQQRHYENVVYLQFLLKGLGTIGRSGSMASNLIQTHNPGYKDPFTATPLGAR